MGPGSPLTVYTTIAGSEEAGSFGPTGEVQYRGDQSMTGVWRYETPTTYTIANLAYNTPSPAIGLFFSPGSEGMKTGKVVCSALHQDSTPPSSCRNSEIQGEGVADNPFAPALTLAVEAEGGARFSDVVVVNAQQNITFKVTTQYNASKLDPALSSELYPPKHAVVSLYVKEQNTGCQPPNQTFSGRPTTPNNFQPSQYFQYLYEVDRLGTPTSCAYEVSFLTAIGQPFIFLATNQRDTGAGQVTYTFAIRGHTDFKAQGLYPGSHYTYALRTTKPDCATQSCVLNTASAPASTPSTTPTTPVVAPDPACTDRSCTYEVSLDQAGFYVAEAGLTSGSKEGFWGGEYTTAKGRNNGGFNMGATLKEHGEQPGFMGFYLSEDESVRIKPYEYTGQVSAFTLTVLQQNLQTGARTTVYGPVQSVSGQSHQTRTLTAGFYLAEMKNQANSPRGQFGLEVNANSMVGGVNVGGWLDSNGKGFAGLYLAEPQQAKFSLYFAQTYGTSGAGKLQLQVFRMTDGAKNQIFSSIK